MNAAAPAGRTTRLREARRAAGLSGYRLAQLMPYNEPAVSRIERGLAVASRPFRRRAAELLGVDEDWLFEDTL